MFICTACEFDHAYFLIIINYLSSKKKENKRKFRNQFIKKKALNLKFNWKIKYEEKWAETVIKNSRWEWAWDPWADEDRLPSYVTNKNMQQWPIYYQCENFPTSDVIDIILQHLPLKDQNQYIIQEMEI